jgi:hypothetical protein
MQGEDQASQNGFSKSDPRARLGKLRIRPVYLIVIERVLSFMTFDDVEQIGKNLDKIIKQRDDIVSQIYRTMLFLASLLILVFLIEINVVEIPPTVWGVKLNVPGGTAAQGQEVNNQDVFIFGFLLIGNIIALLFSSAMAKMFMLEYMLDIYSSLRASGPTQYIAKLSYRFYVFIFGLIADQAAYGVPKPVAAVSRAIHWITVVVLPITFIFLYCSVLLRALFRFWKEDPFGVDLFGLAVETWYFAFSCFSTSLRCPCMRSVLPMCNASDLEGRTRAKN